MSDSGDPATETFQMAQADPGRVRRLAQDWLQRRGIERGNRLVPTNTNRDTTQPMRRSRPRRVLTLATTPMAPNPQSHPAAAPLGTVRPVDFAHRYGTIVNAGLGRLRSRSVDQVPLDPLPLEDVINERTDPLALVTLLAGRIDNDRRNALEAWFDIHDVEYRTERFSTFEGAGKNYIIERGTGRDVVVLAAHHDAVPGSAGANDNASSVAVLLALLADLQPSNLTVRILLSDHEERAYLGARQHVRNLTSDDLARIRLVLSLELVGIGDTVTTWDVAKQPTPTVTALTAAFAYTGVPTRTTGAVRGFASDHRAFRSAGIVDSYGVSMYPAEHLDQMERARGNPLLSLGALMRPRAATPPFDTYHTSRDATPTISADALQTMRHAIGTAINQLDEHPPWN